MAIDNKRNSFHAANHSLVINGAESADSGSYRCEAINLIGESTSIITLTVEGKLWLMNSI